MTQDPTRYEHKTTISDRLPNAEQLDKLSEEGWELIQIIATALGTVLYLRRLKPLN